MKKGTIALVLCALIATTPTQARATVPYKIIIPTAIVATVLCGLGTIYCSQRETTLTKELTELTRSGADGLTLKEAALHKSALKELIATFHARTLALAGITVGGALTATVAGALAYNKNSEATDEVSSEKFESEFSNLKSKTSEIKKKFDKLEKRKQNFENLKNISKRFKQTPDDAEQKRIEKDQEAIEDDCFDLEEQFDKVVELKEKVADIKDNCRLEFALEEFAEFCENEIPEIEKELKKLLPEVE